MHIIFETPRLILRRITLEDAPSILQLNSNPEVLKYLHEPPLEDEDHARRIITDIILPQYSLYNLGRWAMQLKTDGRFIGWCGLKWRPEIRETDLGYRLIRDHWGKGYASEAAQHTLDHGHNILKVKEITGRAHIENTASLAILQKIGMQYLCDEEVDHCPVKTFVSRS